MWDKVFQDMAQGKIAYNRKYYSIPQMGGSNGVTLISPTEQQVQIAKSEMKRNIAAQSQPSAKRRKTNPKVAKPKKKTASKIKPKKVKKKTASKGRPYIK